MRRKASVFGQEEWRVEPWRGVDKGSEQRVFDYGMMLGNLLERSDAVSCNTCSVDDLAKLFRDCTDLYNGIQHLQEQYLLLPTTSHSNTQRPTSDMDTQQSQQPRPSEGPARLILRITALGIQLAACATSCEVFRRIENFRAMPTGPGGSSLISICDQTDADWLHTRRLLLARAILRSAADYLREGAGASRLIFQLRVAIEQFEPSEPEYGECRALLQCLEGKGLRFGQV